ncbi:valacyclovir hydrolase [Cimex lectularius]|uniref:AB hydrolase-1 domain-containing protein n=1 Tax=Cimex lectularius TaxID=79782 RepID=A0A8I6TDN7_CIMLE|nr:valacyclovir hydrolase [Cimex lectularius]
MQRILRVFRNSVFIRGMSNMSVKYEEKLASINGSCINYLKAGNGENTVFCLPGALGTIWSDFKPQVEFLCNHMTVVAWDPPGYGKSRPPPRDFSGHFFERDADAGACLMEHLGIKKFSILGWSDGGITGLIIAGKYAERVDKTIVWGANAYVTDADINLYEGIRDTSKWSEKMRAPLEAAYGKENLSKMMSDWVEAMIRYRNSEGGDICKTHLPMITSKTLIVHGDKDPLVPSEHPKYLMETISKAAYHNFPDGKHNLHLRYSQEFNTLVRDFICDN